MHIINLALRLLRLAAESLFIFEVNRILGRLVSGSKSYLQTHLPTHEHNLLSQVRAPYILTSISLPNSKLSLHTLIAGSNPPGNRPLIILHGHSMGCALFAINIDSLLQAGYTSVYAPDLPGWGRSSRPKFCGEGAKDAVGFFIDPIREWVDRLGLTRFTLMGHSLGAYVAHEYALTYSEQVRGLIMMSPAAVTRITDVKTAFWFSFTPQRFLMHGGLVARLLYHVKYPRDVWYNLQGMRQYLFGVNSTGCNSGDKAAAAMLRVLRAGKGWRAECIWPLLERVRKFDFEIDLIAGDRDVLVHVESIRALHRRMVAVGNVVRLNVIPNADHSPHLCAPARFVKAIVRGMGAGAGQLSAAAVSHQLLA